MTTLSRIEHGDWKLDQALAPPDICTPGTLSIQVLAVVLPQAGWASVRNPWHLKPRPDLSGYETAHHIIPTKYKGRRTHREAPGGRAFVC